ncbi:hypothetical protein E1287_32030 [Actinomadura sp. KC06]|uniref:hypothetical protein n=1 Tax=Actinomadura sp. KC06 TaxID=2530369 RepID=UPI0010431951|nr:hypothetical protein [Actinomadura sp. KC06]TDD28843.1 hypothetical protein E1287_32030 [Actinomadura sp. KC06]
MKRLLIIPAVALTLSLSACGGGSDEVNGADLPEGVTVSTHPDGGGSIQGDPLTPAQVKMATKFVACMRELGYNMPEASDPGFNFAPKDAQGMSREQLNKVRTDSAQCHEKAGGDAMTGG